jgi:DNA-binding IclR family transcriptional regulator
MGNAELEALMDRLDLRSRTAKSLTTKKGLWAEIRQIRRQGYAFDDEEWSDGVRCLGIPVYDQSGLCTHAMSISGLAGNFIGERLERMVEKLLEAKRSLIEALGLTGVSV